MRLSSLRPLGAGRFQLERKELLRVLDEIDQSPWYWPRYRVVPEKEGDRIVGLRVFGLRPDGRCVLLSADRIEDVNGIPLDTIEHCREIGARLRTAKGFVLNVRRKGEPLRFEIVVR